MDVDVQLGSHRLVHLDLKRAPIKVDYLSKVFPLFSSWGATGLLIEWEDTFPYSGNLMKIGSCHSDTGAYTQAELEKIYLLAEKNNLIVIPLVQTFGHLEFVLRHDEWSEMEELRGSPSSICPSHPKALSLVTSLIDQVATKLPPSAKYFHIGADEVWHLGVCNVCCEQDKDLLLLNHLMAVLRHIKLHYPNLRPIMWDDMLRNLDTHLLKEFGIGELVDPMVWIYEPGPAFNLTDEVWEKYRTIFEQGLWVASAFKGATGSSQNLVVIEHHVGNHQSWLQFLTTKPQHPALLGVAITGWSRYDHYAGLCELLPSGLPSLCMCLAVWMNRGFTPQVHANVASSLGYEQLPLNPYPRPQPCAAHLEFPGWRIAVGVEWFTNLKGKHLSIINSDQATTWLSLWHIKHNFVSHAQIKGLIGTLAELIKEWEALESYMDCHMREAYYEATVEEWLMARVRAQKNAALYLHRSGERLISNQPHNYWDTQHLSEMIDQHPDEAEEMVDRRGGDGGESSSMVQD